MFRIVIVVVALLAVANAFAPAGRVTRSSALSMKLEGAAVGLVGSDIEYPEFDPWGLTRDTTPEKMAWYRAAELKHGRVAMLAALGQIFVYFHHPMFDEGDKPFKALATVATERPIAVAQILFFIFAAEALGQFNQVKDGAAPGDLGFDPLNLKPSDPETWEKVQLRELKNGRLAMLASAGQLYTEQLTGNGVLEAWKIGAVSPFNDGQGIF